MLLWMNFPKMTGTRVCFDFSSPSRDLLSVICGFLNHGDGVRWDGEKGDFGEAPKPMEPNKWEACRVLLNTQNCLSGKYSPTSPPSADTPGAHRPKCMFRVVLVSCQARLWEEAVSAVRVFFPRFPLQKL